MKTPDQLHAEHLDRVNKALRFQEVDRPPINLNGGVVMNNYMGVPYSDLEKDTLNANIKCLLGYLLLGKGEIDSGTIANFPPRREASYLMKLPGRELPENVLWQILEVEIMTTDDYDFIIDNGHAAFDKIYAERLAALSYDGKAAERIREAAPALKQIEEYRRAVGIAQLSDLMLGASAPFSGRRSFPKYMVDLHKIPDKVHAAQEVYFEEGFPKWVQMVRAVREEVPCIMTGGGNVHISPKLFERFSLPYVIKVLNMIFEEGKIVHMHNDSNWDDYIKRYYLEYYPKGCLLELDGTTDIFKAREHLGDHMSIIGDVPDWMLAFESAETTYNYVRKLVNEIGPKGYIVSSGCGAPPNTKFDNYEAMILAAQGK